MVVVAAVLEARFFPELLDGTQIIPVCIVVGACTFVSFAARRD